MRGEIALINKEVLKLEENPIKKPIGKHEALHLIAVINDEYWKEWRRKLETIPHCTLVATRLGSWTVTYSKLKHYIRDLVKEIRKCRAAVERMSKDPSFVKENSYRWVYMKTIEGKLQAAWSQLEEQRKIHILRYLLYTNRKRQVDINFKPNKDYTWYDWSFKNQLLNNSEYVHNIVQDNLK